MAFDKKAYQREYMARRRAVKSGSEVVVENTKSDPTLAEPSASCLTSAGPSAGGEARESTPVVRGTAEMSKASDSRGGQTLSSTDQKFEEDRPTWYIFGKEVKKRNCWKCGKDFETRLEMNKFCSPKCKNEYLDTAFTKLRSQ